MFSLTWLVLSGCQGLTGTWQGDVICLGSELSLDGDAEIILERAGGGSVAGQLRADGELTNGSGRQAMLMSWDVELDRSSPSGRQSLDGQLGHCVLYADGRLADETCPQGASSWIWDGQDLIDMRGDGCSVSLSR